MCGNYLNMFALSNKDEGFLFSYFLFKEKYDVWNSCTRDFFYCNRGQKHIDVNTLFSDQFENMVNI